MCFSYCLTACSLFFWVFVHVSIFVQVCPIQDDEDGHLSYKLGDIIENDQQRCKYRTVTYENKI